MKGKIRSDAVLKKSRVEWDPGLTAPVLLSPTKIARISHCRRPLPHTLQMTRLGNFMSVAFLALGGFGLVCGTYTDSDGWCTKSAAVGTGLVGLVGAGIVTLLERWAPQHSESFGSDYIALALRQWRRASAAWTEHTAWTERAAYLTSQHALSWGHKALNCVSAIFGALIFLLMILVISIIFFAPFICAFVYPGPESQLIRDIIIETPFPVSIVAAIAIWSMWLTVLALFCAVLIGIVIPLNGIRLFVLRLIRSRSATPTLPM
ncbi:hypothetical protein BKA62DRAFT_717746 [Auriculariales sp. MPI-PUGE-AT-0066]|nr:hypothetical protein BKA62DRAFT_717746 [Auriculariales sp. MPI-PUGE-AT-0066]